MMGQENVLPALVMVWVVPPEKVTELEPLKVTPDPATKFPYAVVVLPKLKDNAVVRKDISSVGI